MGSLLSTSRYTFRVPLTEGYALFNAATGGVLKLDGADAAALSELLSGPPTPIESDLFDEAVRTRLRRSGFLVETDRDEVDAIRERYWLARQKAPVSLVVTTTMDCNLGCFYCYESRSKNALQVSDVPQLVSIARDRLSRHGKRMLHVDWYGGEPLMNLEFLEEASIALQDLCVAEGVMYLASAISNGTHWPDDIGDFVRRHKLRQVQISFDGLQANHDRRRRYRRAYRPSEDASSFDQAVRLVDRLLQHTRVDLRYNADPGNAEDLSGFIEFAAQRGWFSAPCPCVLMVAKLAAYSDRSAFMRSRELSQEQFEELQDLARQMLPSEAQDSQDIVGGFPYPKTSVCGALAPDSAVIGADGLEYRCGLQVGETDRAVGRMGAHQSDEAFPDKEWWKSFDPTLLPTCSRCSFLPVCWGGCPKRHLEASQVDVESEGRYWRRNLPRLIAAGFAEEPPAGFVYTSADQFRDSDSAPSPLAGPNGT